MAKVYRNEPSDSFSVLIGLIGNDDDDDDEVSVVVVLTMWLRIQSLIDEKVTRRVT